MRPLNRPMFKYGGPIKEGIMDGMKDRTIAGGNQVGTPMGDRTGFADPRRNLLRFIPGFSQQYSKGIANLKKIPDFFKTKVEPFFKSKMQKSVPKVLRDKQGRVIGEGTDLVPTYFGKDPSVKLIGGAYKYATGPAATNLAGKAAQFVTSPTAIGAGLLYTDALPGGKPLFGTRNILGQKFDEETGIKTEGLFGRDLPAKKQLEEQRAKIAAQEEANKIIAQQKLDADENKKLEKIDPKVFEDRKKYYYNLMGLDKLKGDAVYDSLIDASKIIQQEGGDLKGAIRSGNLQTQIIDAISKNLDEGAKLKRQIDAAVLKGEIEKDIYQAKGGSSSEQLIKALAESGNLTEQEVARSRLGLPINVSQAIQVASAAKKGAPLTHDDVVLAATNFAALDNKKIQQQLSSDEVKDKVGSGKQFANELAVVEAALGDNPTAADDGFYIIGTKLIEVVKGKPIPRN
jgi:hypothetical protein